VSDERRAGMERREREEQRKKRGDRELLHPLS
jgi:hypothetical protein